jgi:hypothetical protein
VDGLIVYDFALQYFHQETLAFLQIANRRADVVESGRRGPRQACPAVGFGSPPGSESTMEDAFVATHKDAGYLAEAHKLMMDVSPIDAAGVRRAIERIGAASPETLDYMKKRLANKGSQ